MALKERKLDATEKDPFILGVQGILDRIDSATPAQFDEAITWPIRDATSDGGMQLKALGKKLAAVLLANNDKLGHPRLNGLKPFMGELIHLGRLDKEAELNILCHNVLTKMGQDHMIPDVDVAMAKAAGYTLTTDANPLFIKNQEKEHETLPKLRESRKGQTSPGPRDLTQVLEELRQSETEWTNLEQSERMRLLFERLKASGISLKGDMFGMELTTVPLFIISKGESERMSHAGENIILAPATDERGRREVVPKDGDYVVIGFGEYAEPISYSTDDRRLEKKIGFIRYFGQRDTPGHMEPGDFGFLDPELAIKEMERLQRLQG